MVDTLSYFYVVCYSVYYLVVSVFNLDKDKIGDMKLQKFIASTGYCSRRKAEKLILGGQTVYVNNKLATVGMETDGSDEVRINKVLVNDKQKKIYIKLNKPVEYSSTSAKFNGEKNVYELLPEKVQRDKSLHIVGRLDKNSCGLLLFTNDGALTQVLTHPSFEHEKKYLVKLKGKHIRDINNIIEKFTQGMKLEEIGTVRAKQVKYLGKSRFEIILTEGKKRQIRNMFAEINEEVIFLQRISIGSLTLGDLEETQWKYLTPSEIKNLKEG